MRGITWTMMALLLPVIALATEADPKKVVEDVFNRSGHPEISTDAAKQAEVVAMVDFGKLAKAALGKNKVNAKEFEWFQNTLREIITRTVFPKAPDFLKGVNISYEKVDVKGARATIKSTVQNKADLTEVEYKLENGQAWKVVDVSISGLSWVESIREQVDATIKKKKWQGLKDAMNKRLADLKAGKA